METLLPLSHLSFFLSRLMVFARDKWESSCRSCCRRLLGCKIPILPWLRVGCKTVSVLAKLKKLNLCLLLDFKIITLITMGQRYTVAASPKYAAFPSDSPCWRRRRWRTKIAWWSGRPRPRARRLLLLPSSAV